MNFSKKVGLKEKQDQLDFVDVRLDRDNVLFIDPILIRMSHNGICRKMMQTIDDYFDYLYSAYRECNTREKENAYQHANEVNATRLGYGRGDNGNGNTVEGLLSKFCELEQLTKIETVSTAEDLVIFIKNFAEDGLSDLLTNIIQKELYDYTNAMFKKYNIKYNDQCSFWSWDSKTHNWKYYNNLPAYNPGNGRLLLVPKEIVSKSYLFSISNYLWRELLERLKKAKTVTIQGKEISQSKKSLHKQLIGDDKDFERKAVLEDIQRNPEYLDTYHKNLSKYYSNRRFDADELSHVVYKK